MTGVNHIYIRSHGNCMSNETFFVPSQSDIEFLSVVEYYTWDRPKQLHIKIKQGRRYVTRTYFYFSSILC